jgi:hypothetical protein
MKVLSVLEDAELIIADLELPNSSANAAKVQLL